MQFPWVQKQTRTARDLMLQRLREGVPPDLAARAAGVNWDAEKDEPDVVQAVAEGEIHLFTQARDSGVTGTIRAAMRRETNTWTPKTDVQVGMSLEDYLKD